MVDFQDDSFGRLISEGNPGYGVTAASLADVKDLRGSPVSLGVLRPLTGLVRLWLVADTLGLVKMSLIVAISQPGGNKLGAHVQVTKQLVNASLKSIDSSFVHGAMIGNGNVLVCLDLVAVNE